MSKNANRQVRKMRREDASEIRETDRERTIQRRQAQYIKKQNQTVNA